MLQQVSIAGLNITKATKAEVLSEIGARLEKGEQTLVVTPYSEFLYTSLTSGDTLKLLNSFNIAIPDGVGILWASTYLACPLTVRTKAFRFLQAVWQMVYTGANILLNPQSIYKGIPEKIPGSEFFWDLAELASKRELSIFLAGGFGRVPEVVADKLKEKLPTLRIVGVSNKSASDATLLADIKQTQPDMVFVAFGPITQERWIAQHSRDLSSVKLFIGLGGTFNYVAGTKRTPPKFVRRVGLEWLFRLLTEPVRFKRIYNATIGFITELVKYKLKYNSSVIARSDS